MNAKQQEAVDKLNRAIEENEQVFLLDKLLWDIIILFQGYNFHTVKNLKFSYTVNGGEIFVDRKEKSKSITKSSVMMAFHVALDSGGIVTGPKKLGTFGASYLYPVFMEIGVIKKKGESTNE